MRRTSEFSVKGRPREYAFKIRHQRKQELLLRALNDMRCEGETTAETQAVIDMIHELERLLSMRQRCRRLHMERWKSPKK